ncbi:glycosyltransferase [Lentisphaerota bacterium WC36G]|nr:hypothetical protein LJT99_03990 [Lentisphaerae bacterium WC36]
MHSLLHCFWTGPSFPYGLQQFIKKWVEYLRKSNSDFQIVVWLNDDSYVAFQKVIAENHLGCSYDESREGQLFRDCSYNFNMAKLNFHTFYIAKIKPLIEQQKDSIKEMFRLFIDNKRYTSASNLARILIVNQCGGIYTDIDYLYPNYEIVFPKNIDKFREIFQDASSIGFYMSNYDTHLIENQCVILFPEFKGALNKLLDEINFKLNNANKAYLRKLTIEVNSESQYQDNPVTIRLSSSLFLTNEEKKLMQAFKNRDFSCFHLMNHLLYKDQKLQGKFVWLSQDKQVTDPPMLVDGHRHRHYELTGFLTYEMVVVFFREHLKPEITTYCTDCFPRFLKFFDFEHASSQFKFTDIFGRQSGLYSWANPGYSRLSKLEKAVLFTEKRYLSRTDFLPRTILLNFINSFKRMATSKAVPIIFSDDEKRKLELVTKMIMDMQVGRIQKDNVKKILKIIISTFLEYNGRAAFSRGIGELFLILLSNLEYKELTELINPNSQALTEQNIIDFCFV